MAKNAPKTNALGVEYETSPETFGTSNSRPKSVKPSNIKTRNISITLQEDIIEKLERMAEREELSKSKFINRLLRSLEE